MSPKPISPVKKAWYNWKALRLPWRKRFLIGLDLEGNTFWEFRDTLSSHKHRMRRIVQYPHATHYSEVKISPQWHQWLRHTRLDPPSLTEQSQDLVRQQNLKVLAAQADARWAAKPSFLDTPERPRESQSPFTQISNSHKNDNSSIEEHDIQIKQRERASRPNTTSTPLQSKDDQFEQISHKAIMPKEGSAISKQHKEDPWKNASNVPSEDYQPSTWSGNTTPRGRR